MAYQVEKRLLRPVDVFEDKQQRLLSSQRREQPLGSPLRFLSRVRRLGDLEQGRQPVGDGVSLVIVRKQSD